MVSCEETPEEKRDRLTSYWMNREIYFPARMLCVTQDSVVNFRVPYHKFSLVTYVDSATCLNNGMLFKEWKEFMEELDTMTTYQMYHHYFLATDDVKRVQGLMKEVGFTHQVSLDTENKFLIYNRFPIDPEYNTFLMDEQRKILCVGSPFYSPEIKEQYKKIIKDGGIIKIPEKKTTEIQYGSTVVDMGTFDCSTPGKVSFEIKNVGDRPLRISQVMSTSLNFRMDYTKDSIPPRKKWKLDIQYVSDRPRTIDKEMYIYCNTEDSPIVLTVKGEAR